MTLGGSRRRGFCDESQYTVQHASGDRGPVQEERAEQPGIDVPFRSALLRQLAQSTTWLENAGFRVTSEQSRAVPCKINEYENMNGVGSCIYRITVHHENMRL